MNEDFAPDFSLVRKTLRVRTGRVKRCLCAFDWHRNHEIRGLGYAQEGREVKDIATSPIFYCGAGMAARAVVLRVQIQDGKATKYVVHDQYHYADMNPSYGNGDYFKGDQFAAAYYRWSARSAELFDRYPLSATQGGPGAEGLGLRP